jgi:hypothetical protein
MVPANITFLGNSNELATVKNVSTPPETKENPEPIAAHKKHDAEKSAQKNPITQTIGANVSFRMLFIIRIG